jgi:hypothetical protein
MEKPFDLKLVDIKEDLVKLVNSYHLPGAVISIILRNLLLEVDAQVSTSITHLRQQYEEALIQEQSQPVLTPREPSIGEQTQPVVTPREPFIGEQPQPIITPKEGV